VTPRVLGALLIALVGLAILVYAVLTHLDDGPRVALVVPVAFLLGILFTLRLVL
jgi:hypothetical protein